MMAAGIRPGRLPAGRLLLLYIQFCLSCPKVISWLSPKLLLRRPPTFLLQATPKNEEDLPVDSALSRMDQVQRSLKLDSDVLNAAASVTQQSCELLGTKSVGVDYGLVRTGLAATVGYDPKPLGILSGLNNTEVCQEVISYCQSEQASQIVVGLPLHKNGTEAEQTNLTRIFAKELTTMALCQLGPQVPVYMWDERYTSKFAAARAHSQNPDRYLYGTLDADAACIILEHFYSNNGKGAHAVDLPEEEKRECLQVWEIVRKEEEEAHRKATEERLGGKTSQRQEAMERARKLEAELKKQGTLGVSRKKKKKKKRKNREKRGPWLVPENPRVDD